MSFAKWHVVIADRHDVLSSPQRRRERGRDGMSGTGREWMRDVLRDEKHETQDETGMVMDGRLRAFVSML